MNHQISMFEELESAEESEKLDLSRFSDQELIALRAVIEKEVLARKLGKSAVIQRGEYEIGQDIPAGSYRVMGNIKGTAFVVHDKRSRLRYNMVCYRKDGIGKVTLNDGDIMWVNEPVKLIVYTGHAGQFE